jgi:hypothetical protein
VGLVGCKREQARYIVDSVERTRESDSLFVRLLVENHKTPAGCCIEVVDKELQAMFVLQGICYELKFQISTEITHSESVINVITNFSPYIHVSTALYTT